MKKKTTGAELSKMLGVTRARGMEAVIKAQLISTLKDTIEKEKLTHAEIAKKSNLPRSAITGILSGSLQKVTIDRILRIAESIGLVAEVKLRRVA